MCARARTSCLRQTLAAFIALSAIGDWQFGRTVHASVTLRVTLGNAKTLGKYGVVTLVTPKLHPMCARTRTLRHSLTTWHFQPLAAS
jgi:hypothetical protein